jgi:hypothetical protein
VRVGHHREDDPEDPHEAPVALHEGARERRGGDQAEQRQQRVHARFLRIRGQVRVDGGQRGRDQPHRPAEDGRARPQRDGDRREREDERQRV